MNDAAGLDIERFFGAYRAQVADSCPNGLAQAVDLWTRLDPRQWSLEWHLPVWLGDHFGLTRAVSHQVVLSNVLGLAAVRLLDDLADGDAEIADRPLAQRLAKALYAGAIAPYARLLLDQPLFWGRLEGWMAEWYSSALIGPAGAAGSGGRRREHLASRGAPLKISALAVCILANREAAFGAVEACLDHALTGMVLYDHACDWEEDLAAGRWNAFVAATGDARAGPDPAVRRARVLAAMMARRAVARYFARISVELEQAVAAAGRLGVTALASYLAALRATFASEAVALEARYEELGSRAASLLFRAAMPTALAARGGR